MSRSYLFPLLLQGSGTGEVEGLSSYLCRLSIAHNVPVGVLLRNCYSWHHQTSQIDAEMPYLAHNPGSLAQFVRPNEMTRSLLAMLTAASGQPDLRSGTFMCLVDALARCMRTFHRSMRWCPVCFSEAERSGTEPYFKLYWSLTAFTRCPQHGVPLVHECPHCGSRQDGFGTRKSCAHCARCEQQLSTSSDRIFGPGSWQVEAADLTDLLERAGAEPDLHFPRESVRSLLQSLLDRSWERDEAQKLWAVIPRDEYLAYTFGQTPITLMTARRLAFRLGVPLLDLLEGTIHETPAVLDPSWTSELPKVLRPKRRAARHDRARLLSGLSKAVKSSEGGVPISLTDIARKLGVTTGCLRYHFPTQSKAILERFSYWRGVEQDRKTFEAHCAVVSYVARHSGRTRLTHKGALRKLLRQTGLPKDLLRHEIAKVIDSEWIPARQSNTTARS